MSENLQNASSESLRIVLMGDSSRDTTIMNSDILNTHLTHIKGLSPQPNFIFFLGDMVNGSGKVEEELEAWKSLVNSYYPMTTYYPVLGNHDHDEIAFSNAFLHLPNEQLSGYRRTVYYIDYRNARFIILNSNRKGAKGSYVVNENQRVWLENVLKGSNKKYNFVMFHVPAFPTGHHYGESLDSNIKERNALWSILDRYKVTAVFVGHEHNYSRRLVDRNFNLEGELELENSIYHITVGGAGTSLNAHITDIKNVRIGPLGVYHYAIIDIKEEGVFLQAYDRNNIIIDAFSLDPITEEIPSSPTGDILIPISAEWKYLDDGSDQGVAWRAETFDDSAWASGLAELGYGDGGEATVVGYGPSIHKKYITTYFRKCFVVNDASLYKKLTIRIQRDDGAVVYLNGKEVYRSNMPSNKIEYNTLALKALNGLDEVSYEDAIISTEMLKSGENIVAVEIHQASTSSSDISFNFQLLGHREL